MPVQKRASKATTPQLMGVYATLPKRTIWGMPVRVEIPFEVPYLTPGVAAIEDVIGGLSSAKLLIEEGRYNLGRLVPGLEVEQVQVSVWDVSCDAKRPRTRGPGNA
jgi:hypothetical protein